MTVHNALVGAGLRDRVKIGASGKVATGIDIVKRLIQGADYTNAARAMMMAVGCIQAQRCHTNTCPVGVATQDPRADAGARRPRQEPSGCSATRRRRSRRPMQVMASMGLRDSDRARAAHAPCAASTTARIRSYAELFEHLADGQLLAEPPASWEPDWDSPTPTGSPRDPLQRP